MLDGDIKVTRVTQDATYNQDGSRTDYIRVEFYVGKHGPFIERFAKDSYTGLARDQKLNDFAREVRTS